MFAHPGANRITSIWGWWFKRSNGWRGGSEGKTRAIPSQIRNIHHSEAAWRWVIITHVCPCPGRLTLKVCFFPKRDTAGQTCRMLASWGIAFYCHLLLWEIGLTSLYPKELWHLRLHPQLLSLPLLHVKNLPVWEELDRLFSATYFLHMVVGLSSE